MRHVDGRYPHYAVDGGGTVLTNSGSATSEGQITRSADGTQLGLVNTSHRLVWDYQAGYSRFGSDDQLVWGPTKTFPAEELATLEAQSMDENEVAAELWHETAGAGSLQCRIRAAAAGSGRGGGRCR